MDKPTKEEKCYDYVKDKITTMRALIPVQKQELINAIQTSDEYAIDLHSRLLCTFLRELSLLKRLKGDE